MLLCLPFSLLRTPGSDSSQCHSATFACMLALTITLCSPSSDTLSSEAGCTRSRMHLRFGEGGNVDQITELRKGGKSGFAMAQGNGGAAGANAAVPQVDGAAVADGAAALVNGAVLPRMDGAGVHGAGPAAAPVAVALFPQGLVHARFDVDGVLLGPLPRKSNGSCKILSKIVDETWP